MPTTRKLVMQASDDRIKLPGIFISPASTKSAQQKVSQKYIDPLMDSYRPKDKLPAVARSVAASPNSTNFESGNVKNSIQFPSINDVQSAHSDDNRAMTKEECTKIKNNKKFKEYLGRDFNYTKGSTCANEYNLKFMAHRKEMMENIKVEREELGQRAIAISVQSEESEDFSDDNTKIVTNKDWESTE